MDSLVSMLKHHKFTILLVVNIVIFYEVYHLNQPSHTEGSRPSHTDGSKRRKDLEELNKQCVIPVLTDLKQFFSYLDQPKAACHDMRQIGGQMRGEKIIDGDKWVCFDQGFKPYDCVTYSFGINNEWSYDDAMDQRHYCQVYSFDPTMKAKDHKRSDRISFYNLGISNFKGYTKMRNKECKMDTYRGIVEMLNHRNTIIDYLKMDIEGSEVPFFNDVLANDLDLLDNVKQIGLEIHPGRPAKGDEINQKFLNHWEIFHRLECQGWRLLNAENNKVKSNHYSFRGTTQSNCYEVVWIKA